MKKAFIVLFFSLFNYVAISLAQVPIGQWQEHLPYNTGSYVLELNNIIYSATADALITVDLDENATNKLSKVNGLSETGIQFLTKNENTESILIAYSNSNVDIIKNNTIKNYSDIKRKNIIGDKKIYAAYSSNQFTYLCTGFGIVVLDEARLETKDTYYIGTNGSSIKVNAIAVYNNQFIVATTEGLKVAPVNSTVLNNYNTWQIHSGLQNVNQLFTYNNQLFAVKNDSIYKWNATTWNYFYHTQGSIKNVTVENNDLLVCVLNTNGGKVDIVNSVGAVTATLKNGSLPEFPKQAIRKGNEYWLADFYKGLFRVNANSFSLYTPNAPQSTAFGELVVIDNDLYAAAGSVNDSWNYQYNSNGVMKYTDNKWEPIWRFTIPAMDSMLDFLTVTGTKDNLYLGSFGGGLLQWKNNTATVHKQNKLQAAFGDPNSYRVSGLALDAELNVWISNFGTTQSLKLLQPTGQITAFAPPFSLNENAVAQILIDDANQKWIVAPKGNGLLCYNHGTNITAPNDDQWRWYRTTNGNLPSNEVNCVAKDKDGIIWIGTGKGIALIQCVSEVFSAQGCVAVLPIVQNDQFAGYLFQNESVQCIAVDGANRKWVGTKNGVWLISSGGEKIIYRFSEDNSPLLNNDVRKITIHPKTGEVFFATLRGICSFRSTATEAATNDAKALVFPNPVPSNFNGQIGIKNLPENAIVKITDVNGRLVYQTKALGGQAVWDGKNYKGEKMHTGVYLVLATNETNNEKQVAKIVFIQ